MNVQIYNNVFEKTSLKTLDIQQYFDGIKNGDWQDSVLQYRAGKAEKNKIPAITASGTFPDSRKADMIGKHSGIICIDIDAKDNADLLSIREVLYADKYVFAAHVSVGGLGLAIFIKINPVKHLESFTAIEKYLSDEYHLVIDQACKDVSRLRFVSYDPEIYINNKAQRWDIFIPKKQIQPDNFNPVYAKDDIDFCIDQLINRGIDITASYHDWIRIAFAFCNEFGESGRGKFHKVSKMNQSYDHKKTDLKYDNCLKNNTNKTSIATFFYLCKSAGIEIKLPRTKIAEDVSRIRRKNIGKSGGAKDAFSAKLETEKYLKEMEGIDDAKDVINKVFSLNENEIKDSEESGLQLVIEYIKSLGALYNTVTKTTEINGDDLTDKQTNSIYLTCRELFPKSKVTKDLVCAILESDRIKEYNPFVEFFNKYKHLKPSGNVEKLANCILVPKNAYTLFVGYFLEKWLLSIISSANGTYSLLILVLIGEQSTNKTNFFRKLLPDDLQRYYAESKMDDGKDSEILMSKKLLIVDDEFGGKSKKEAEKLKEIASKQTITLRKAYGRNAETYHRYAVMGGTSNEMEVLNDTTGNRRIIPIQIVNIDFEKFMEIDKVELFIELYHKWKETGNNWMLTKEDIAILNENTTVFAEISMEEDLIQKHFEISDGESYGNEFMTSTQMITHCESFLSKQRLYPKKFGQVLRKLGYKRTQKKGVGYGYFVIRKNSG